MDSKGTQGGTQRLWSLRRPGPALVAQHAGIRSETEQRCRSPPAGLVVSLAVDLLMPSQVLLAGTVIAPAPRSRCPVNSQFRLKILHGSS